MRHHSRRQYATILSARRGSKASRIRAPAMGSATREYKKQEEERRRAEALKESREQLIAIVQAWSFARSFDSFFEDMQ